VKLLRVPFALRLGDGQTSFGIENVLCEYDERPFEPPTEVAAHANQLVDELQRTLGFELTNEPAYRLLDADIRMSDNGVEPSLALRFQRTNYFDYIITNLSLDRKILDAGQTSLRAKYVKDISRFEDVPLANTLSVMILLVSEPDDMVLLARRGEHVAVDQGKLQVSAGGAMRLAVDHDEHLRPSPFITGQRELAEEVGVRLSLPAMRLLGLGVDTRTGEPELLAVATTPLTVKELQRAFRTARYGSEELANLEFVPFTVEALVPYLTEQAWCPGDWVCCHLALVDRFGTEEVDQHLAWQTSYGTTWSLAGDEGHAREAEPSPDGHNLWEKLRTWRKRAPLRLRQIYGWGRQRIIPHYLWAHPEFERYRHWLMETEKLSRAELEAMQLERLQHLLRHAYENVPYYRNVFDERDLKPTDISRLQDLAKLPVLTREEVRRNLPQLVAQNTPPDRLYYVMTGGTTGVPLGFYHERDVSRPHEAAFMYRQWSWAGYRLGDRVALLRPYAFSHTDQNGDQSFWDYCAYDNSLLLSNYLMSQKTLPLYLKKLREFNPKYIQSFPSALYVMARYMLEHDMDGVQPEAIFTEFEQLYPGQRALIEEAFGCPVLAGYGHSERAVDAVECLERSGYHVCVEYGVLELTDEDGHPVPPGEVGFITGTGLDTHCMPFIRYQTDDLARSVPEPCPCGRTLPLITDIVGRWQHEVVVTRDERYIPVTTLNTHGDAFDHVEQYQFFQETPGELVVRIVPLSNYSEADTRRIQEALLTKTHGEMEIQMVFVSEIPRTRRGKHRMLVQEIPVSLEHYYQEGAYDA
jgi:phenylacetate-CoA ligase